MYWGCFCERSFKYIQISKHTGFLTGFTWMMAGMWRDHSLEISYAFHTLHRQRYDFVQIYDLIPTWYPLLVRSSVCRLVSTSQFSFLLNHYILQELVCLPTPKDPRSCQNPTTCRGTCNSTYLNSLAPSCLLYLSTCMTFSPNFLIFFPYFPIYGAIFSYISPYFPQFSVGNFPRSGVRRFELRGGKRFALRSDRAPRNTDGKEVKPRSRQ